MISKKKTFILAAAAAMAAPSVLLGALAVAQRNAGAFGVGNRVDFIHADFSGPLPCSGASFDLVISNPPYVSMDEYSRLDGGVRDFEPYAALVPGPSGMELPAAVVRAAQGLLVSGGLLLMEHGWKQGGACRALCRDDIWKNICTGRDLAGNDRFLSAERR